MEGGGDASADRKTNVSLAERRTSAIRTYLHDKGIALERIYTVSTIEEPRARRPSTASGVTTFGSTTGGVRIMITFATGPSTIAE
jgi:hypothetical protein